MDMTPEEEKIISEFVDSCETADIVKPINKVILILVKDYLARKKKDMGQDDAEVLTDNVGKNFGWVQISKVKELLLDLHVYLLKAAEEYTQLPAEEQGMKQAINNACSNMEKDLTK